MVLSKSLFAAMMVLALAPGAAMALDLPPGVFAGEGDYTLAPAGTYSIDPAHTAVVAKVSHIGYSKSVFRFDKVEGTLTWDPAEPAKSTLTASVETASISTPVPGFAAELSGAPYLNSAAFPKATFVSTAFRRIDARHAKVEGAFTLMGETHPLVFAVELFGAGKGFMGHPRIGAEATAALDPKDFKIAAMLSAPVELTIDVEFGEGK